VIETALGCITHDQMKTRNQPFQRLSTIPALLLLLHCSSSGNSPLDGPHSNTGANANGGSTSENGKAGAMGGSAAGAGSTGGTPSGFGGAGNSGAAMSGVSNGGGDGGSKDFGGASPLGGSLGASGSAQGGAAGGGTGGFTNPNDNSIPMTIPTPSNGQGEIRNGTTVLSNAANGGKDVWDFANQRIGVNNASDCDDGEDQVTVFEVDDGVTVRNLIIAGGLPGGNGIVCSGDCTLEYVYWEDVCEDAATNSKDGATMTLNHVIALHASDKVFQHNAKAGSKTILKNSFVADFGKLWRSCGDCTANGGPRHLVIDNVRVDGVNTAVAGANQNYGDTVTIDNLYVKDGYDAADDDPNICTEYIGVTDHNGESTELDDGKSQWDTATCKVSQSDIKSY
jgi:hypothetical protein